jgi:DedD protein
MSDLKPETASTPEADEQALKKRLLGRIAIAGIVVVALLGGLAVFDALNAPPPRPVAKAPPAAPDVPATAAADAAKAPTAEAGKEAGTEEAKAPAAEGGKEAAKQVPAEPAKVAEAAEPAAAPEHTSAAQARPLKPLTPPASARPAMVKPSEPLVAARPEPGRDIARAPAAASPGPLSPPLSQAVQAARRFVLQMGVFNNVANAEELRAKLELNGIPAQIEARVQVGPFATREEADAAREKLRALGLDGGILTAVRK